MTSISQNTYIDIANKYNNTFHSTIRTKSIVVKPTKYVESSREVNSKDIKFEIVGIVGISKYRNIFAKGYVPNWSEKRFVITQVKNTVLLTYVISDCKGEEIVGTFYKKELQKINQKEL